MQEKFPFDPFDLSNAHNEPSTMSTSLTLSRMQSFNEPIQIYVSCLYSVCLLFILLQGDEKFFSMNNGHEQVLVIFIEKKIEASVNRNSIFLDLCH